VRRVTLAFVATVAGLVVLLSFKTAGTKPTDRPVALSGATPSNDATAGQPAPSSQPSAAASTATPSTPSTPSTSSGTNAASGPQTVTGSSVRVSEGFRTFGFVQVQVTVQKGKILKVQAVNYPNGDPQSAEISQYSIPVLGQEVLKAQGTSIDVVSGATYTTQAYAQSVQAALDKAKS
jgi:uncharacterized protein with FMN-binding domain